MLFVIYFLLFYLICLIEKYKDLHSERNVLPDGVFANLISLINWNTNKQTFTKHNCKTLLYSTFFLYAIYFSVHKEK